jgi:PAS domain S-box-containing protein
VQNAQLFEEVQHELAERKRAEEALQLASVYNRSLIEASLDPLVTIGPDGKITDVNAATEAVTGYSREELIGTDFSDYFTEPENAEAGYQRVFKVGMVRDYSLEIRHRDGHITPVLYNASVYRDEEGKVTGVFAAARDITERKQAEEALREAQERLIRQEKLAVLGQLAGGVGHELRNPLGAIKNAAYFLNMALAEREPEPEVKETLEILEKEVGTSERIISSLLDFARPRPPVRRKVDVNELVREALSRAAALDAPRIEVVCQLEEGLPTLLADPDQLAQVFGNIIRNGIQAMPKGGQLVVKSECRGDPGGRPEWVTVSFTDTGVGISEENLKKIFEPLFTTKAKGIGLGLAVTKTLVEGHGGSIKVESEEGKGSTFVVRLPVGGKGE